MVGTSDLSYRGLMSSTEIHSPGHRDDSGIVPVISEYIGVLAGYCGGEPHILGHRIKVRHVAVWHEQMGMTPAQIVAAYPAITLAQVHAALAYYYSHGEVIKAAMADADQLVEELKATSPPSLLQEKLRQRNAADNPLPS